MKVIIFVVIGILLGLFIGNTSIFWVFGLLLITGVSCFIYILSLFFKKEKRQSVVNIKQVTLLFVASLITSSLMMYIISYKQQK